MIGGIPDDWRDALAEAIEAPSFQRLAEKLARERARTGTAIYPPEDLVFNALRLTPFDSVRAVILGQDPYRPITSLGDRHVAEREYVLAMALGESLSVFRWQRLRIIDVHHREPPGRKLDERAITVTDVQKVQAQHPRAPESSGNELGRAVLRTVQHARRTYVT